MNPDQIRAKLKKAHPTSSEADLDRLVEKECTELSLGNKVSGVEIFAPGTHNGDEYTEQDVDDMVAAFKELDFRPALKVGHTKDTPGSPAFGWITNLRKAGGKLLADFESMHDTVIQALRDRRYDRVSSEIYFNLKRKGKVFRRALKAVALLGAEPPAVADLVPLHKMEFAAEGEFASLAICDAKLELQQQVIIDSLTARVAGLTQLLSEQKEQDDMTIKELRAKKEGLEAQLKELSTKAQLTDAEKATLAQLEKDIKKFGADIETEIADLERRASGNADLQAQVTALAAKDRAREASDRVAKCTIPAFRPQLSALYLHAMGNPDVRVKIFSTDKDGKQLEAEKSLAETLDALVVDINAGAKNLFSVTTSSNGAPERQEGPTSADAGLEVDQKASARVRDGKSKTYDEAVDAVLAEDKELAKRYSDRSSARAA